MKARTLKRNPTHALQSLQPLDTLLPFDQVLPLRLLAVDSSGLGNTITTVTVWQSATFHSTQHQDAEVSIKI